MTSGKPKLVSTRTTADTDAVSAVLYPSNKAVTWGQMVYECLYEFADRAFIIHDPILNRLYASTDAATIAAMRACVPPENRFSETVMVAMTRVYSIFYQWLVAEENGDFWFTHCKPLEGRPRTLWDTIDRVMSIGKPLGRQPLFLVDQFDGSLRFITLNEEAASAALAAVVPAGNSMCFTLELRKGPLLPFEGGET